MLVRIVGYNKFSYTNKNNESKEAYRFYVEDPSPSGKITFGIRCYEVFASKKYGEKLLDDYRNDADIHIGWGDKDRRPFLYTR